MYPPTLENKLRKWRAKALLLVANDSLKVKLPIAGDNPTAMGDNPAGETQRQRTRIAP